MERKTGFEMPFVEEPRRQLRTFEADLESVNVISIVARRRSGKLTGILELFARPVIRIASLLWLQSLKAPGSQVSPRGGVESVFDTHRPLPERNRPSPRDVPAGRS